MWTFELDRGTRRAEGRVVKSSGPRVVSLHRFAAASFYVRVNLGSNVHIWFVEANAHRALTVAHAVAHVRWLALLAGCVHRGREQVLQSDRDLRGRLPHFLGVISPDERR